MPNQLRNFLPEKDYAGWLAAGLVLLVLAQVLSKSNLLVWKILRYFLFAAAVVNYGMVLYWYNRDREAKKKEKNKPPAE